MEPNCKANATHRREHIITKNYASVNGLLPILTNYRKARITTIEPVATGNTSEGDPMKLFFACLLCMLFACHTAPTPDKVDTGIIAPHAGEELQCSPVTVDTKNPLFSCHIQETVNMHPRTLHLLFDSDGLVGCEASATIHANGRTIPTRVFVSFGSGPIGYSAGLSEKITHRPWEPKVQVECNELLKNFGKPQTAHGLP